MSDEENAYSLSDLPATKNKVIKRKKSLDKLLKNKYIYYSEEELKSMNNTVKEKILNLDSKTRTLKSQLTKEVEKLNGLITTNSDLLFDGNKNNSEEIKNLEKYYYLRKHDHTTSMKLNSFFKQQYNALKQKSKNYNAKKLSQKLVDEKTNFEKLKIENTDLTKKIQELQFTNIKRSKDFENWNFISKCQNELKDFSNILNDTSFSKFECHSRVISQKKAIGELKEHFQNLTEYIQKNNKILNTKDEIVNSKIKTTYDLLQKDLNDEPENIIQKCYEDKLLLKPEIISYKNSNNMNRSISQRQIKINNTNINIPKLKPIKNKNIGRSFSSVFENNNSNFNSIYNSNNSRKSRNKINKIFIKKGSNNKQLSVFSKFKILGCNKPLTLLYPKKIKSNVSSMFVTKEVIDFSKKSPLELELEKELENVEQEDFQQLINLKGNYVEINDRLLNDIKEKKKVCDNRIKLINICLEKNKLKLEKIKEANKIIKKELDIYEIKIKKAMIENNNNKIIENNKNSG